MATSRGITDTKLYDYAAVVDRYGIPPELIPDFYGLKGDTSDNIPGVPGIGDKTASQLLQKFGDLEGVLGSIDEITGAKRKENLANHADNARLSKVLATMRRDLDIDLDVAQAAAQVPDRSKLREVFREFELRDPLRRLEEFLGADEAAPAPVASTEVSARVRRGHARARRGVRRRRRRARAGGAGARDPRGRAAGAREHVALRRRRRRRGADRRDGRPGPARGRRRRAAGRRLRRQGVRRRAAEPRPRRAAGRLPARARAPRLPAARAARGARPRRARRRGRARARGAARRRAVGLAARADRRPRPRRGHGGDRAAARAGPAPHGARGRAAEHRAPARDHHARARGDPHAGARDLGARRDGVRHRLAAAARRDPVHEARAVARSGAARPASRPTRGCCRRSATSIRSSR